MPVLERAQLAARPLADLHAIASQLGIAKSVLLRKPELAEAVLTAQGEASGGDLAPARSARKRRARRARRRHRTRSQTA
jgi:hypothetical protein